MSVKWKPSLISPQPHDGRVHFRLQHLWRFIREVWAPNNNYKAEAGIVPGLAPF
jgi:hypothetical protein